MGWNGDFTPAGGMLRTTLGMPTVLLLAAVAGCASRGVERPAVPAAAVAGDEPDAGDEFGDYHAEKVWKLARFDGPETDAEYKELYRHVASLGQWVVPSLVDVLVNGDDSERVRAANVVAAIGARAGSSAAILVGLLYDRSVRVRRAAGAALGCLGEQGLPAIPALVDALHDPDMRVRHYAAEALGMIGPCAVAALPTLRNRLYNSDELMSLLAAEAVSSIDPSNGSARTRLIELIASEDDCVGQRAARAVWRIGVDTQDESLLRAARNRPRGFKPW